MMRRYGQPAIAGLRYRHRPGVYALLPRDGRLLVTFQAEPVPEVQFPGGGIDPGEATVRALHREVFEETGWSIARPRRIGSFRRFAWMPDYDFWAEKVCHLYVARPVRRLGPPLEAGHSALWLTPDEALDRLDNPGERDALARFVQTSARFSTR
ncbi:NUDIX hydrolase [Oceanicola granulosus HTCC2516]|uniref:NUDIX hydrolase n=1 Tax=Oceanicola granulosus (strain ATCC BAA-861 / DSM 15982 / KCTC 12143 / HTCC2516) TaxID=314256 RepID=Q2CJS5_OCEGH|nr:NUDIX hydrolase [Oceanicola granulosus]EAR53064.1 NUDIX hydrolase [Oceanicola granulosus HTCC2516]